MGGVQSPKSKVQSPKSKVQSPKSGRLRRCRTSGVGGARRPQTAATGGVGTTGLGTRRFLVWPHGCARGRARSGKTGATSFCEHARLGSCSAVCEIICGSTGGNGALPFLPSSCWPGFSFTNRPRRTVCIMTRIWRANMAFGFSKMEPFVKNVRGKHLPGNAVLISNPKPNGLGRQTGGTTHFQTIAVWHHLDRPSLQSGRIFYLRDSLSWVIDFKEWIREHL